MSAVHGSHMMQGSPPKRPKLSLSIKPTSTSRPSSRPLASVDPKSPTAFNTLSNVYVTAIERSTPVTAINTSEQSALHDTKTRHAVSYPETPLTADPVSPKQQMDLSFPSIMTATPPMSAGGSDANEAQKFSFSKADTQKRRPTLAPIIPPGKDSQTPPPLRTPHRRRASLSGSPTPWTRAPYSHPRTLHSILRNSPLPPGTAKTPMSPRHQSVRIQEKASRRVAYQSPLEQTITTNKYTKSHIDLLIEDASPASPTCAAGDSDAVLDLALAFTGDETRDGGQTPGPFEEMRRRMAGLAAAAPMSPAGPGGIRKRKQRKEKKRRWVWTIGQEGEEEENDDEVGGAVAAMRAVEARAASEPPQTTTPITSSGTRSPPLLQIPSRGSPVVEQSPSRAETLGPEELSMEDSPSSTMSGSSSGSGISSDGCEDIDMSDGSSDEEYVAKARNLETNMDPDMRTPIVAAAAAAASASIRTDILGPVDMFNPDTGSRRDTPVPADMMMVS